MFMRIALFLVLLFSIASCTKKEERGSHKPLVLVSVAPYIYFVNELAGGLVDVEPLVPVGANPHIYEATPKEVERHRKAVMWVYLGESLDKKILQFFRETGQQIQIVDVARKVELLSDCGHEGCCHTHEGADLHIWLSPTLAKQQARNIAKGLAGLLPEQKDQIEANLQTLLSKLDRLNEEIAALLSPMRGKAILVSHPAFAYFCKDYDLVQLSIEVEGKDPLPQDVTEILQQARSSHVQTVLVEPQYSNKGAELIADSLHLKTHMVDPYAEDYAGNLLLIAQVIAE
jgi:zinc transport system substrate-binding protein